MKPQGFDELFACIEEATIRLWRLVRMAGLDEWDEDEAEAVLARNLHFDIDRYYDKLQERAKRRWAEKADQEDLNVTVSAVEPATCHFESDPKDGPCAHCGQYHF